MAICSIRILDHMYRHAIQIKRSLQSEISGAPVTLTESDIARLVEASASNAWIISAAIRWPNFTDELARGLVAVLQRSAFRAGVDICTQSRRSMAVIIEGNKCVTGHHAAVDDVDPS